MATINPYLEAGYIEFDYFLESQSFPATITASVQAIKADQAKFQDITWDAFAESEFIDRTWDEWPGDKWDQGGVLLTFGFFSKTLGGYLAQPVKELTSASSVEVNAVRVVDGRANNINSAASVTSQGSRLRGVSLSGDPLIFTGLGSVVSVADVIAIAFATFNSQFTTSVDANAVFDLKYGQALNPEASVSVNGNFAPSDITQLLSNVFSHSADANAEFDLAYGQEFTGLASALTEGRVITLADPFLTLTVPQELRTILVPIESRLTEVLQETRVNTVEQETRAVEVKQETRNYKVFRPPLTGRPGVVKTRQDV